MKHVLLPCQLKIQISPRSRPKFTQWDCRPWQFHPQQSTHTSSVTRKEFINAGVTAYAVGCTDEGLRKELLNVGQAGAELDGSTGAGAGANVVLKSKIRAEEVEECILWVSIVFITILCTPQPTIVRWSSTPAVSAEAQVQWRGFCALIANAYYVRGMAWLPVKTLQMEQLAVVGYAEEPSLVADRMRLVFATLEVVSPQWPKR
ncbi:hypothetical protein BDL97_13G040300 [Sphagnum fallax]|nr:hypothetical protein BDL97_13G040300 [Sphagnum fallax]